MYMFVYPPICCPISPENPLCFGCVEMFSILLLVTMSREQGSEKLCRNVDPSQRVLFCFGLCCAELLVFWFCVFSVQRVHSNSFSHSCSLLAARPEPFKYAKRMQQKWFVHPRRAHYFLDNHAQNAESFQFSPPRRRGRRAVVVVGWLGGSWGKVVAPPHIACKLVKVWIYVRNIVCSCFAHIRTNTRKTRQNDLAAYANWSQLADWHLIQAVIICGWVVRCLFCLFKKVIIIFKNN